MAETLTQQDVQRLLRDPSPDMRAELAVKLAGQFDLVRLSPSERTLAEDIVRIMARDVALRVRAALAESLRRSPGIPHDVALTLARDVEEVALPFIEVTSVLTDEDLIEIVRSGSARKQEAIAKRGDISESVSDALVDAGSERAVATLMGNPGARVSEGAMGRALDRFPHSEIVHTPLVNRARLPVTVAERLVTLVSEQLRERLVATQELPVDLATDIILQSRERAICRLAGEAEGSDLIRLVGQLGDGGRLTPSLLLRALCMGDLPFFEAAMAHLASVPIANARMLIHDEGRLGLRSLFRKARLPENIYPAIRVAVDVARETEFDGGERDLERYRRRMLQRILTQFDKMAGADLDFLLNKLSDLAPAV